ncbi:MAG: hypothetical protein ACKOW8_11870 [Flavobacteriales bacterium]
MDATVSTRILSNRITCLLAGIALIFAACKPEENFEGPSLEDQYGPFEIIQNLAVSTDSLNASTGEVATISAAFNKNVNWTLQITGANSGGKYIETGYSLNPVIEWNGSASLLPMFQVEDCYLEMTIKNQTDTLRDTITLSSVKPQQGFLLADFESGLNSSWVVFAQTGANMSFVVSDDLQAAQGNRYYDMAGEVSWDWLIGMIDMPASAYGSSHFPLNANPDEVYFNTFLFKPEDITNGIMLLQFREDDNGDGVYSNNEEDMFSVEIRPNADGWKHYYYKYSELATLINGAPSGAIGNGLHEPDKLIQVSILYLANPSSGYSKCLIDNLVFTEGQPLVP